MALPVNIEELVHGQTIEWERLEFKEGWNPEDIMHSMCAFANDLNNWGGGYIIVGIAEVKGQPVFPPAGLLQEQMDALQGKVVELGSKILPNFYPVSQPYLLDGKHVLALWCPAGDNRPYTALTTLGKGGQRQAYVRIGSKSIIARGENQRRLQELTARIPFDDRINHRAQVDELDLGLIQAYLQEIKSDLYKESTGMSLAELSRAMLIAKGSDEDLRPVNVGLLFFTRQPEKFFSRPWIELVWHQDGSGKKFKEYYFKGAVHQHLRDALSFLSTNILAEQVAKRPDRAEADRFFNFPYDAVEEALSNAVYHKSYELHAPIEVQVWPDKIEILSYPGPVPPVTATKLKSDRRIVAREYRNRRIGDFLKELHLTEGRGTGFPTIYDAMRDNGSPKPVFETDDDCTYFLVTLPAHELAPRNQESNQVTNGDKKLVFKDLEDVVSFANQATNQVSDYQSVQVSVQVSDQVKNILDRELTDQATDILQSLQNKPQPRKQLLEGIGLSNHSKNKERHIDPLIKMGWVNYTIPKNPKDRNQKYRLTEAGQRVLQLIN